MHIKLPTKGKYHFKMNRLKLVKFYTHMKIVFIISTAWRFQTHGKCFLFLFSDLIFFNSKTEFHFKNFTKSICMMKWKVSFAIFFLRLSFHKCNSKWIWYFVCRVLNIYLNLPFMPCFPSDILVLISFFMLSFQKK